MILIKYTLDERVSLWGRLVQDQLLKILCYFIGRCQSFIQLKNNVTLVVKSNKIVTRAILILAVNMLLVHFTLGLRCNYFRSVDHEGTQWQKDTIMKLDKEKRKLIEN